MTLNFFNPILNWSNNHWKILYQSLKVFDRSLLIKKRLHYKSITVLSLYVAPPIIQRCSTTKSFSELGFFKRPVQY
jgi:hypothetical protein